MQRLLYTVAIFAIILMFSCDSPTAPFDDSLPDRFTLSTSISPEVGGTVQPSEGEFLDGARIELRATANEGFIFQEWQGDRTGTDNPDIFLIRRNMNITSVFAEIKFQLEVNVIGEGTVTQELIDNEASKIQENEITKPSSTVTENGIDVQRDGLDLRDSRSVDLRQPEAGNVRLQQDRAPPQADKQEEVQIHSEITEDQVIATYRLTAEPAEGWQFDRWEGDLTGDENPTEIIVDSDKNVTAIFVQIGTEEFTLELTTEGQGLVDIDPDLAAYPDGTEVTLNAVPEEGWRFARWQGDLGGNENPAVLLMDDDKVITSVFEVVGAPQLTVSTQPSQTTAGEAITPAPAVTLVDGTGDPLQGISVTMSLNQNSFTDSSTLSAITNDNGIATFTNIAIATAASGYRITFDAELEDVSDIESSAFSVVAAAGDPSNSSATVPDGVAGEETIITITVQDEFDNPVSGVADDLNATVSGANSATAAVTEQGADGEYRAVYTPTNSGEDQIEITLDGDPIDGSPFTSEVTTSDVSSANSTASVDPEELRVGNTSTLTITLRDDQNNAVSGLADEISISGVGNATFGNITEDGGNGIYTSEVTNTVAETLNLTIIADKVTITENLVITFLTGDPDAIEIITGNNQTGTVSQELAEPLTVEIIDEFSNSIEGETVVFEIIEAPEGASGQSLDQTSVQTNSEGRASATLTLGDVPGDYLVEAAVGTTGSVTFIATAQIGEPSQMIITQQPGATVAGSAISPAPSVEITDDAGNPIEGISLTVSETDGYTFDAGTLSIATDGSGIAAFIDLVIETTGTYSLVFNADAAGVDNVTSDPFEVESAAGEPANTTASVPDGTAGNPTAITITVLDQFDNRVSGIAGDLAITVTGVNSATPTASETAIPGEYSASYTPTVAGEDEVAIMLGGTSIAGSPFTSTVTVSDISATNSSVEADPISLQAGDSSTLTIELRDDSNNPISNVTDFTLNVSGEGDVGTVSETSTAGTYETSVTNTTAQTVTVTVTADGVQLQDQPEITFMAADPSTMTITTEPEASIAGEPIVGPPTVEIVDSYGNPVPDIIVNVTEQDDASFITGSEISVSTNSSGFAIFGNIAIGPVGSYNLVFSSAGVTNRTSNVFTISSADPDAGGTTANVPNGSAGDATNITVTVRDAFGNRVEGVASLLEVSVTGGPNEGAEIATITDSGNGVYSTSYTPTGTGDDEITITLDGVGIEGSPFTSTVSTSDAEVVIMEQQPLETVAGEIIVGPPSVQVNDGLSNGVPGVDVTVSIQGGMEFDGGVLTQTTDAGGIAVFGDLVLNTADSYVLIFDAVGVTDDVSTDPFDVTPAAVSTSQIVSGNNQSAVVTQILAEPFILRVEDTFGNPVSGHTVEFATDQAPDGATGQSLSETVTTTDALGEASTVLTLGDRTGTYTVSTSAGAAGTREFTATADPDEADSFVLGSVSSPQTAGQNFEISITAFDEFGNTATGYSGTASLSTTAGTITPDEAVFSSGQATLDVSVSEAGIEQTITATDVGIEGTSNSFEVVSGGVDADESSANATTPHTADGIDASQLTIELLDSSGNVISGLSNEDFDIGLTGNAVSGEVLEFSDGQYQASITNTVAETVNVTVTVNSVQLTDQPQIEFTAGEATQISSLTIADAEITLDGSTTVTATVLDANTNPVQGVSVNFVSNEPDRATVASPVLTNASGEATATVTGSNNESGEVAITASISDADANVAISDSKTVGLTVQTGSADAAESTISADPSTGLTADGSDSSTLTITLRDSGGNLLEGEDVFFAITAGTGGSLSSGPWTTNASGQATATLTSTDINTIEVTGYLGLDDGGLSVGSVIVEFDI